MELTRGANIGLSGQDIEITVAGARQGTVDLLVFQLTEAGTVRSDADFIFFNQPTSPEGGVRLTGVDSVAVATGSVPADVHTLAVAVALDDSVPGSLADHTGLGARLLGRGDDHLAPALGLTTERAAVLVEIYRRQGTWKLRNVSAGWAGGFADLVRTHGVVIDDEPAPAAAPPTGAYLPPPTGPAAPLPPPPTASPDGVRSVPGEERLSLQKRQTLDLRKKEVAKVLLTKGAGQERARVILVMDKTGSMTDEFKAGLVHRVVEKMVPVAIQLDSDGALEAYLYASKFAQLPDLKVEYLEQWMADFLHMSGTHHGINYRKLGVVNDERPIMTHLISTLNNPSVPTLILFFTDGGFYKRKEIAALMRQASSLPAFWQFVGIGRNDFGVLSSLDELDGRVVDNAGFFPVTDIDRIDDAELYRRLLSEFPDWLRAARAAGILR